jgi:hypothetical protein
MIAHDAELCWSSLEASIADKDTVSTSLLALHQKKNLNGIRQEAH